MTARNQTIPHRGVLGVALRLHLGERVSTDSPNGTVTRWMFTAEEVAQATELHRRVMAMPKNRRYVFWRENYARCRRDPQSNPSTRKALETKAREWAAQLEAEGWTPHEALRRAQQAYGLAAPGFAPEPQMSRGMRLALREEWAHRRVSE